MKCIFSLKPTLAMQCVLAFCIVLFLSSSGNTESVERADLQDQAAIYFQPIEQNDGTASLSERDNSLYQLGKALFYDPRLSASQSLSCHNCHHLGLGGADQQETSIGHGWRSGRRNSPTILNSGLNPTQFWDGRAADLEEQAASPLQEQTEMNNTTERIVQTLASMPTYQELFSKSFPEAQHNVTMENISSALAFFQSRLTTPNSRFDQFISGDINALSETELDGLALFMDRNCASCHYGNMIGGKDFHRFGRLLDPKAGVRPDSDFGRYEVTGLDPDKFVFRVAPLRNVALTRPYFHSGKVWRLHEAVEVMAHAQLGFSVKRSEAKSIAAFLRTLTGTTPEVTIPVLPAPESSTPQPRKE